MKIHYYSVKNLLIFFIFCILHFTSFAQTINTIAGTGIAGYNGDGIAATAAQLNYPDGVSIDTAGNVYISEWYNHRIRKITISTGIISTIAGTGVAGFSGDGGLATAAQLKNPAGIVSFDAVGNIYITDNGNHRIRKITVSTGIISTIAGTGTPGYNGDGIAATAAQLNYPVGVSVDGGGTIYIGDNGNQRVRKIDIGTGTISTIAGTGTPGYNGDGIVATAAQLRSPRVAVFDVAGNIYIADDNNNRIRKITISTGIISTIAGTGTPGYNGDGIAATTAHLKNPYGVTLDSAGNVYISDTNNDRVRKIDVTTGIISTIAGTGVAGFSGDGGLATAAQLRSPYGVAIDKLCNMYIVDESNNRIRKIAGNPICSSIMVFATGSNVCSGSCATINASPGGGTAPYTYVWVPGGQTTQGITVCPTSAATYTVIMTDASGGTATDTATVTVNSTPIASISGATTICAGSNATLSASGGGTYTWSTGGTTSFISITPTATTNYSVVVTNGGCNDTAFATVTLAPTITATIGGDATICVGNTTTLTASGGTNYSWSNGQTTVSITLSPTVTTTYSVIVSSGSCYDIANATVTISSSIITNQSASVCTGSTYTLPGGTVINTGGTYIDTLISIAGCDSIIITTLTLDSVFTASQSASICSGFSYTLSGGTVVSTGGVYIDTLISVAGCDSLITTTLTVNPNPTANAFSNITIVHGQSVTLTASGGGTYNWNNGSNGSSITVAPFITTIYCVTVADANNCTDTACVTVTIEPIDCSNAGEIYLPNAFSPNGDGENDKLRIFYGNLKCVKTFELVIYNRWGEKVFKTTNPMAEWDGFFRGKIEGVAVFVYYMEATLISGEEIIRKGNISLIK